MEHAKILLKSVTERYGYNMDPVYICQREGIVIVCGSLHSSNVYSLYTRYGDIKLICTELHLTPVARRYFLWTRLYYHFRDGHVVHPDPGQDETHALYFGALAMQKGDRIEKKDLDRILQHLPVDIVKVLKEQWKNLLSSLVSLSETADEIVEEILQSVKN